MYCNRCGNLVPRGSKFCRHCGTRLDVPGAITMLPDSIYSPPARVQPKEAAQAREVFKQAFEASERGDTNGAILLCKQAIALDPSYAPAHSLLGMLYERINDKRAAYAEYEIALRLNPQSAADRAALKRLQKELGLPEVKVEQTKPLELPHVRSLPLVAVTTFAIALIFLTRAFYRPRYETPPESVIASVTTTSTPLQPEIGSRAKDDVQQKLQRIVADAISARQRGDFNEALRLLYEAMKLSPNDERIQKLIGEVEGQKRESMRIAAIAQGGRSQVNRASSSPTYVRPPSPPQLPSPVIQHARIPSQPQIHQDQTRQAVSGSQQMQPSEQIQTIQRPQQVQPTIPQFVIPQYYPPVYQVRPPMLPQQQLAQQPQQEQPSRVEESGGRIVVRVGGKVENRQQPSISEERRQEQPQRVVSEELSVDELERKAIEMHCAGELNKAIPLYIRALERNADIAREGRLRQNLADAYRQTNRLREAAREYRRAIDAYQRQLKLNVGDPNEIRIAIRACEQSLELCK